MKLHDFVKYNNAQVIENAVEKFQEASGIELYAGDERLMLINTFGYMLDVIMAEINYRANNCVIALCDEETLYLRAEDRCVERIEAEKAYIQMRFSLAYEMEEDIVIPKGTRVTSDGITFFETEKEEVIEKGNTYLIVECRATESGSKSNGIDVGKVNIICDSIPYITSVENIGISYGGRDQEDLEAFRERVINAPKGFSTAGAELAYIAKVKEVDSSIVDVKPVYDEEQKILNIYVLCSDGNQPTEDLIERIREYIYQPHIKASTDKVEIKEAVKKEYTINCSYHIDEMDKERESQIKEKVNNSVEQYIKFMESNMGKKLNPEILKKYMYNAGAAIVYVTDPVQTEVLEYEYAVCISKTVTYDGLI